MTNQPETVTFLPENIPPPPPGNKPDINKYGMLLFMVVSACLILFIIFSDKRDRGYEKEYKKEMKALNVRLDSLKKARSTQENVSQLISEEITELRTELAGIKNNISVYKSQLSNLKKEYEKISRYDNISGDSLRRIFSATFGR